MRTTLAAFFVTALGACGSPTEPIAPTTHVAAPAAPTALPVELELHRLVARAAAVTVRVEGGSGTVVSSEGHVLTAAHVVEGGTARITWSDGAETEAAVVVRDEARDLALLAADHRGVACVPLALERAPIGAWVALSGFPRPADDAIPPHGSIGLVLGADVLPPIAGHPERAALLTTAHDAPGMSGGPALDARGHLIGVVAALGGRLAETADWAGLAGLRCETEPLTAALGAVIVDAEHDEPDRDASLRQHLPARGAVPHPSVVTLHVPMGALIAAVLVAPDLLLTVADPGLDPPRAQPIDVVDHPSARVHEVVAADGELALVRVEGLALPVLAVPMDASIEVGSILEGLSSGRLGVVSGVALVPGHVVPFIPAISGRHCGTLAHLRALQRPPVDLRDATLAHDVSARRGELLADAAGLPVAIHVGDHVDGVGYAVLLSDALRRLPVAR